MNKRIYIVISTNKTTGRIVSGRPFFENQRKKIEKELNDDKLSDYWSEIKVVF